MGRANCSVPARHAGTGEVASCQVFGVFVRLDQLPEVTALLEIQHFAVVAADPNHRIQFPADYPAVGARIETQVLGWCLKPIDLRLTQLPHSDWSHRHWLAEQQRQQPDREE